MRRLRQITPIVFVLAMLWASILAQSSEQVSGIVRDSNGRVAGAVVRIQTTTYSTETDEDGTFTLNVPGEGPFNLTAWAPGYYIVGPLEVVAGQTDAELVLVAHHHEDNAAYEWLPSEYHPGAGEDQGCAACHSAEGTDLAYSLPVDEWRLDAHSQSAANHRFLTMYTGTDVEGNRSPLTRYGYNRDYGRFPLHPDPAQPYYGPGYQLDFPDTVGNCAACHTPAAAVNAPYDTDPTRVSSVASEGVPCDFCHKVWEVRLDSRSGRPYPNMPGVLSYEFRRPPEDHQFFAGPFDDVAPGEDTYSALQTQSQFCASCHFGVFWDTVVYNSFGEWLASPYSDPQGGQTCQDCHMPPLGAAYFARPDQGGRERNPEAIFSHRMPGARDVGLLQNTLELDVDGQRDNDSIQVEVRISNIGAGHHVPTDSPLRQVLVIVTAQDAQGSPLQLIEGSVLPDWTGDVSGLPGTYYVKILQELWTEVAPSGAYWMPTRIVEDTRLAAFETDVQTYTFSVPGTGAAEVDVRVIFRRAFYELMQQKGWDVPDILMEETRVSIP